MTLTRSEREPVDAERVTRSVELDAAPARVWDALTEDGLLGEWLADEVELEAEPGGEIVCRYADGEERRGEVSLVEEAERLAFEWRRDGEAPSRVELTVDVVATGTRVTVIESGDGPGSPALVGAAWASRLRALPLVLGRLVLA